MISWKRGHYLAAAVAFGVPMIAYLLTVTPTVPFWDSGEFIATSYILGLPHPPGNPVYTMLGRVMSFLPIDGVAWRVNFMSSLASALCALFTFLIVTRALERTFGGRPASAAQWIACRVGGLAAAFFTAFSTSFWDSAIEAEVYSVSSFMIAFVIWLAFRWWDRIGETGNDKKLILIAYLLAVSTGIHLGTVLVAPGLVLLLAILRPGAIFNGRFWASAAFLGPFLGLVVLDEVKGLGIHNGLFLLLTVAIVAYYVLNRDKMVRNNLATWWVLAIVAGFTVQFFLLVRSQQMPHINEGMPITLDAWKEYLSRKQYGPATPFVRRAELWYQVEHMYFRYVWQQFQLVSRLGSFGESSLPVRLINVIPYFLFFTGAAWNWKRDQKTFWFFAAQHVVMGPFLIFYLNFTDHEVRERDYFFTNSYHLIAIWMGMGATAVLAWVLDAFAPATAAARRAAVPAAAALEPGAALADAPVDRAEPPLAPLPSGASARAAVGIAAASLLGISLLPAKAGWYTHDRSNFYIAHDYAYNMLTPLEKDAVVFTNGDNDTFPLWYIQEVEGVRKDVRVVNMSLLNTPWYITQLRDQAPRVPLSYSNEQLASIQPYMDERTNNVVWVKDQAFADIVKTNAWRKPLYLAVTVPEQQGMERQLTFEGLVFRIQPKPDPIGIDAAKTKDNLYRVFQYRGLLDKNRAYDRSVYKDENANRLVQNYTAAHVQLATYLLQTKQNDPALRIMQDALKISPDFPGLHEYMGRVYEQAGRPDLARRVYEDGLRRFPNSAEFHYHVGLDLFNRGKVEEGIAELRRACELSQQYFDWYNALFAALWNTGRPEEALEVLRTWTRAHPDDSEALAYLRRYTDSLQSAPSRVVPRPAPGGAH